MISPKYVKLVLKQIWRNKTRSFLTVCGVLVAMFLFTSIQSMQAGVRHATEVQADDTTLVVYRKDRYCPFTSNMPQNYEQKIRQIAGVKSVVPIKIVVNNCRTSLDVVTFRGVPKDSFINEYGHRFNIIKGTEDNWKRRSDAALLGETLAKRRGLKVGDQFDAAGITVYVAGVIKSDEAQDQNVAYVHLDFLQFASGSRSGGIVTQFNVTVTDPSLLDKVASSIDNYFSTEQEPTTTSTEKSFVARVATDVLEIVDFMQLLAYGCLLAVLALVGNAIILSVQDRIREHAVFQTLGYSQNRIASLIIMEGVFLSVMGAVIGCALSFYILYQSQLTLSVDSQSIPIKASPVIFVFGVIIAGSAGVLAGLVPAWQASRRDIVSCFRSV